MGRPATASGQGPSPIPVLRPQKPLHMPGGEGHRGKSLKLLEKIPEDAEATVVLVGEEEGGPGRVGFPCALLVLSSGLQAPSNPVQALSASLPFLIACLAPSSLFLSSLLPVRFSTVLDCH